MNRLLIITALLTACHVAPTATAPRTGAQPAAIAELATRRAQLITWLHEYTEAAVFPTDALGRPLSVFEDEHGVRCPMAELIYRDGHADLVAATKRDNNTVRLRDVTSGPLFDWMAASGLTHDEIAMVQGAMDIDYTWMRDLDEPDIAPTNAPPMLARAADSAKQAESLAARAQARGRLESAERALRDGTRHALVAAVAAARPQPLGTSVAATTPSQR